MRRWGLFWCALALAFGLGIRENEKAVGVLPGASRFVTPPRHR